MDCQLRALDKSSHDTLGSVAGWVGGSFSLPEGTNLALP